MKAIRSLLSASLLVFASVAGAQEDEAERSYGYVRTLEGSATLVSADTDSLDELILNHPVLTGDRVIVAPDSRLELVLSDFNIVRLGGDTEVELARLAYSADTEERSTTLVVLGGDLQVVVSEFALGDELPVVVLPNATVYLHEPGSYRVLGEEDLTVVVVRSGYAEVSTERGSAIARAEEEIRVEGTQWPAVAVRQARPIDELESWGEDLLAAAGGAVPPEIDPALSYSASALDGAGEWVEVDGETAWSPYVEESWRPYTRGTWVPTPAGVSWIDYEPWGWVTGHYGYWSPHPYYGWLWYPGAVWAPAWVHWYWGPSYVGWVPWGYYGGYYGGHLGMGLGYYGWAGGYWSHYDYWTFCPTSSFGYGPGYYYSGSDMPRRTGRTAVPRGVITTDTRGITRANWRDGVAAGQVLSGRSSAAGRTRPAADVTSFVARQPELSAEVREAIGGGIGVSTTRTIARREPGEAQTIRSAIAARAGDGGSVRSGDTGGRVSRLAGPAEQAWRERGSGRRIYTVDRSAHEAARQAGAEARARSMEGVSFDAPGGHGRTRTYSRTDGSRWSLGNRASGELSSTRRSSPARRVVEGVTSSTRGRTRASTAPKARWRPSSVGGSSRGSSTSARPRSGGSRPSSPSVRSSGSSGRSAASTRSSGGSRSRSSGSSAKPKSSGGSNRGNR